MLFDSLIVCVPRSSRSHFLIRICVGTIEYDVVAALSGSNFFPALVITDSSVDLPARWPPNAIIDTPSFAMSSDVRQRLRDSDATEREDDDAIRYDEDEGDEEDDEESIDGDEDDEETDGDVMSLATIIIVMSSSSSSS